MTINLSCDQLILISGPCPKTKKRFYYPTKFFQNNMDASSTLFASQSPSRKRPRDFIMSSSINENHKSVPTTVKSSPTSNKPYANGSTSSSLNGFPSSSSTSSSYVSIMDDHRNGSVETGKLSPTSSDAEYMVSSIFSFFEATPPLFRTGLTLIFSLLDILFQNKCFLEWKIELSTFTSSSKLVVTSFTIINLTCKLFPLFTSLKSENIYSYIKNVCVCRNRLEQL